jgi:hypothetical protein
VTVRELIAKLSEMDQDATVIHDEDVFSRGEYDYGVREISTYTVPSHNDRPRRVYVCIN